MVSMQSADEPQAEDENNTEKYKIMTTTNERITTRTSYASDTSDRGSLTDKQMQALHDCARLSPGYEFCVACYGGTGSRATHVMVYREGESENYVGLVGKETVQFYDNDPKTEAAVKRVAHRVYRFSGFVMQ